MRPDAEYHAPGRVNHPSRTDPGVALDLVRTDNHRVTESLIRVVLADDDVLLREGLASLLDRSGLEVVGQAGDAAELIEVVRHQRPELAVVDIRMPPKHTTEGLDAARVIQHGGFFTQSM